MKKIQKIVLGGGCFWCLDPLFRKTKGVENVVVGYAGGDSKNPTYREICGGQSGHAEVLEISFDENIISLSEIFKIFFTLHDPTTLNRQGADKGTQYRSIILYNDISEMKIANEIISKFEQEKVWENNIVTEVVPLEKFYPAEDYHQDYFNKNPDKSYCQIVISPKMEKFEKVFSDLKK